MIISGSRTTQLSNEPITNKCSNCGTLNSMRMMVFQKYTHVFWIPFFPTGKTGSTQCSHCKQVLEKKEFTQDIKEKYESVKANSKTPPWTFSGLAILIAFVTWAIVEGKKDEERNAQMILTPQKGDVYTIKKDDKQFTLYKVDDVVGDTAFLLVSQYETNRRSAVIDLQKKGDEAYSKDILPVLKKDLKTMLEKSEIVDIERKSDD